MHDKAPSDDHASQLFAFFNEVGIISQLSRALLDARLPDGVTTAHYTVLNHLIRVADGRTPLELARAFQVPKTTMTHTLSGLEKRGFVETRPNPEDRRSKRVWLTEEGRNFRDGAVTVLSADLERLAKKIDADQIAGLIPQLADIRRILDTDRD